MFNSRNARAALGTVLTVLIVCVLSLVIWLILRGAGVTWVTFNDVSLFVCLIILGWFGALFGASQYDFHNKGDK